jgi:hypothetical protein
MTVPMEKLYFQYFCHFSCIQISLTPCKVTKWVLHWKFSTIYIYTLSQGKVVTDWSVEIWPLTRSNKHPIRLFYLQSIPTTHISSTSKTYSNFFLFQGSFRESSRCIGFSVNMERRLCKYLQKFNYVSMMQ